MVLVVKRKISVVFVGGLLLAAFAAAPARAEDDTLFGQPAPKRFLLNKMLDPKNTHNPEDGQAAASTGQAAGGNGQAAAGNGHAVGANGKPVGGNGQVAAGEASEDEDDGPGPFPKRYLLNKLFDANK